MSLYNERAQPGQHIEITFSDGWLCRFKARWGLRTFKSYGESGDANNDAVQIALPGLRQRLANFSEKDIFNADECGVNYNMAPERTVALQRLEGRKK